MIIHSPSYTFCILNAATVILAFSKLEGDLFFFDWKMTLCPSLLYLVLINLWYLKKIIFLDEKAVKEHFSLKLNQFQLLDHFFHLMLSMLLLFILGYTAYILDLEDIKISKKPIYIAIGLYLVIQFLYTFVAKSMENESLLPTTADKKTAPVFTTIMSPILNFLGSSFVLCGGGTCSGIYGSTISAIGSAFGISVSEWLPFLDWLTLFLVIVSVVVLYYAKKSLTYKPFLVSCVAAALIFADSLVFQKRYPIYVGNVLMIGAAIWNSKMNKANLMPFVIKKKKTANV